MDESERKQAIKDYLYPDSIEDAIFRWDNGETLFSVDMGGMGPGYEQAIQVGFVELLRELKDAKIPEDNLNEFFNAALDRVLKRTDLGGISGAQAGAIKNLACNFLQADKSWEEVLDSVPDKTRKIQISKTFPTA